MVFGSVERFGWLEHPRQGLTCPGMSAASSLLKPFAGFQLASLDAVAIAIAETNVELSPDHTLSGSSEIPAKSLAPILTHPEPLMEAVSEIVLGVPVAGRRRESEPLHRDALRPRNHEAVSIPQSKVVLRDIMVGHGIRRTCG